jgi:hypothetical protein
VVVIAQRIAAMKLPAALRFTSSMVEATCVRGDEQEARAARYSTHYLRFCKRRRSGGRGAAKVREAAGDGANALGAASNVEMAASRSLVVLGYSAADSGEAVAGWRKERGGSATDGSLIHRRIFHPCLKHQVVFIQNNLRCVLPSVPPLVIPVRGRDPFLTDVYCLGTLIRTASSNYSKTLSHSSFE